MMVIKIKYENIIKKKDIIVNNPKNKKMFFIVGELSEENKEKKIKKK